MKIFIANDHAGFDHKKEVLELLSSLGHEVIDLGTNNSESCNYATYAIELAKNIQSNPDSRGVLICGSGIGVSLAANRFSGVRAARCTSINDVEMTRKHNNANVLCLGSRVSALEETLAMIKLFLSVDFESGRHLDRVDVFNGLGEK